MTNSATRKIRLLSAVSLLGLACGMLAMSATPAGAAVNKPATASVRPLTCSPNDLPYRFSSGTSWETPWLEKVPNGCQSVWATSGQTFNYEVIDVTDSRVAFGTCNAGFCQIWNPAPNYDPFFIVDTSETATSVNIFY